MAWDSPPMQSGSVLDFLEFNQMVEDIKSDWTDLSNHAADSTAHNDIANSGGKYTWAYESIKDSGNEWSAAYQHSSNAKNLFANSSNVRFRFPASSTAISRFADSSNIRFRFKSSSNVWVFASSQNLSGNSIKFNNLTSDNAKFKWKNNILSTSGSVNISGLTTLKRVNYPVLDIQRHSTYTSTLIDGARLSKHQLPGTTAGDGTGVGFVFQADNASGTDKRIGMFGGILTETTDGQEVGEIVFNAMSGGADVQARHFTIRSQAPGAGDNSRVKGYVGVPWKLQVGKDLNVGLPTNKLEVSGNAIIYSGSLWIRRGGISSQNLSGQLLALSKSRDINNWSAPIWHNSGLMWNNTIGKWIPHKSGAANGIDSGDYKPSSGIWHYVSSQLISGGQIMTDLITKDANTYIQLSSGTPSQIDFYITDSVGSPVNILKLTTTDTDDQVKLNRLKGMGTAGISVIDSTNEQIVNFKELIEIAHYAVLNGPAANKDFIIRGRDNYAIPSIFFQNGTGRMGFNRIDPVYHFDFSGAIYAKYAISTQKISGQLLSLSKSRDINNWSPSAWHNSGLVWDNSLQKWKPLASGGVGTDVAWSGAGGFATFSSQIAGGTYSYNAVSSQTISGGTAKIAGTTINSTFSTNWDDLTDGGATTLHSHTGLSSYRIPCTYLVYTDAGKFHAISGETGVAVSSNAIRAEQLLDYVTKKAKQKTTGADIHVSPGIYPLSGVFYLYDNTRLEGSGKDITHFYGKWMTNSEIVISGSNISVSDFSHASSMRLTCRNWNNNEWHDITYDNLHARNITTSGHRGRFEFAVRNDSYQGHLIHGGHNRGTFNFQIIPISSTSIWFETGHPPLASPASGGIIHDVRIINCSVISSSSFGPAFHGNDSKGYYYNIWVENCLMQGIGRPVNSLFSNNNYPVGYSFNEDLGLAKNIYVKNCVAKNVWRSGFHNEYNPKIYNITYENCLAEDCGVFWDYAQTGEYEYTDISYGDGFKGCHSGTTLINCKAIRCRNIGIGGEGINVQNCYIDGGNIAYSGISLYGRETQSGFHRAIIQNNELKNLRGKHGISVTWCSSNIISNNKLTDCGVSGTVINVISNVGGSVIENNVIDFSPTKYSSCNIGIRVGQFNTAGTGITLKNNIVSNYNTNGINFNSERGIIEGNKLPSGGRRPYNSAILIGSQSNNSKIINNYIANHAGDGITTNANSCIIDNNTIIKSGRDVAILLGTNYKDNVISNNFISGSSYAMWIRAGCDRTQVIGNKIKDTWAGTFGINNFSSGSVFADNYLYNIGGGYGILSRGKRNLISNNYIDRCTLAGILLSGTLHTVKNNTCIDSFSSKTMDYGIREIPFPSNPEYYNIITNNYFSGNTVAGLLKGCTNSIVKYNVGYTTENRGCNSVANGGTIAHGCAAIPKVIVTPSGSSPIAFATKVDATNITVYHTSPDSEVFNWLVEV